MTALLVDEEPGFGFRRQGHDRPARHRQDGLQQDWDVIGAGNARPTRSHH